MVDVRVAKRKTVEMLHFCGQLNLACDLEMIRLDVAHPNDLAVSCLLLNSPGKPWRFDLFRNEIWLNVVP